MPEHGGGAGWGGIGLYVPGRGGGDVARMVQHIHDGRDGGALGAAFFFQAEDGIRDGRVTEFRRVLFRSSSAACSAPARSPETLSRRGHVGELRSRGQGRQRSWQSWREAKKWRRRWRRQPGVPPTKNQDRKSVV